MVCTYHETKAFIEFVTPNGVTYGLHIIVPTLQVNRLSQRGSLKQGAILPIVRGIETDRQTLLFIKNEKWPHYRESSP